MCRISAQYPFPLDSLPPEQRKSHVRELEERLRAAEPSVSFENATHFFNPLAFKQLHLGEGSLLDLAEKHEHGFGFGRLTGDGFETTKSEHAAHGKGAPAWRNEVKKSAQAMFAGQFRAGIEQLRLQTTGTGERGLQWCHPFLPEEILRDVLPAELRYEGGEPAIAIVMNGRISPWQTLGPLVKDLLPKAYRDKADLRSDTQVASLLIYHELCLLTDNDPRSANFDQVKKAVENVWKMIRELPHDFAIDPIRTVMTFEIITPKVHFGALDYYPLLGKECVTMHVADVGLPDADQRLNVRKTTLPPETLETLKGPDYPLFGLTHDHLDWLQAPETGSLYIPPGGLALATQPRFHTDPDGSGLHWSAVQDLHAWGQEFAANDPERAAVFRYEPMNVKDHAPRPLHPRREFLHPEDQESLKGLGSHEVEDARKELLGARRRSRTPAALLRTPA